MKKPLNENKVSWFEVFLFVLKVSFIGFGGGNALFPIMRSIVVKQKQWMNEDEFERVVIATNALPGASVIEAISYICIKVLGSWKGVLVTLLGLLPHILFFFALFIIGQQFIPIHYLRIIYVAVIPVIIAMIISFIIRYIKLSKKNILMPRWIIIIILVVLYNIFVPSPFNIPAVGILIAIIFALVFTLSKKYMSKHKLSKINAFGIRCTVFFLKIKRFLGGK